MAPSSLRWRRALPIRFYGFDVDRPMGAFHEALENFQEWDPWSASHLQRELGTLARAGWGSRESAGRAPVWRKAVEELLLRLDTHRTDRIRRLGRLAYDRQRRCLVALGQYLPIAEGGVLGGPLREQAMADTIQWILDQEGPGAGIFLWTHNCHLTRSALGPGGYTPLGRHLAKALGPRFRTLALVFHQGEFLAVGEHPGAPRLETFRVGPGGTLDEALHAAGPPTLFLDLRALPAKGPVKEWFATPRGTRLLPMGFKQEKPAGYVESEAMDGAFDGLLFVDRITAVNLLDLSGS